MPDDIEESMPSACSWLRHSLPNTIPQAPEVIMLLAEPRSTPPPRGLAMSNGLEQPTRLPCSTLRVSLSLPMPTAASGYVMPHAKKGACGTPSPSLFPRADVAGNAPGRCPHYQTLACSRWLRRGRSAIAPSAHVECLRRQTLPLVAPTVAPLIEESTVIGDANAAPRHEQRRAARERAGMPGRATPDPAPENATPQ